LWRKAEMSVALNRCPLLGVKRTLSALGILQKSREALFRAHACAARSLQKGCPSPRWPHVEDGSRKACFPVNEPYVWKNYILREGVCDFPGRANFGGPPGGQADRGRSLARRRTSSCGPPIHQQPTAPPCRLPGKSSVVLRSGRLTGKEVDALTGKGAFF
jgi:hypothetical protein